MKDADKEIILKVKESGRLVNNAVLVHSYPFCWRSETPLIYKAVPSYFVAVEQIKDKIIENNKKTYWVPAYVQEKRFHNWLENARDWAISRNRYVYIHARVDFCRMAWSWATWSFVLARAGWTDTGELHCQYGLRQMGRR